MADYSIFILQEGDLTVSGGGQLDGVNQGDGSHMLNRSITLNTNNWIEIPITDNDPNFADNDSSQRLAADVVVDGVTYTAGTIVEAEFRFDVENADQTESWTLLAFNFRTTSPSYGTVEGVAFIGPQGGFPPIGEALNVTLAAEGPSFAADTYAFPICFGAGTLIDTPRGGRPVERLRPGDTVLTADGAVAPILWTGRRTVQACGAFAPVVFERGTIGNSETLKLSQQHRLRLSGAEPDLLFGESAVLVPARSFAARPGIQVQEGGWITYVHLMLDHHGMLVANGSEAESFYPGETGLASLTPGGRAEIYELFPELRSRPASYGAPAHPCVGMREGALLKAS